MQLLELTLYGTLCVQCFIIGSMVYSCFKLLITKVNNEETDFEDSNNNDAESIEKAIIDVMSRKSNSQVEDDTKLELPINELNDLINTDIKLLTQISKEASLKPLLTKMLTNKEELRKALLEKHQPESNDKVVNSIFELLDQVLQNIE